MFALTGFSSALQQELNSISDGVFGVLGTLQALPDGESVCSFVYIASGNNEACMKMQPVI